MDTQRRRADDGGWACWLAKRLSETWDFVDRRDIDKHVTAWAVFGMTFYLGDWVLDYVFAHPDKPGLEVAAIVTAIMLPWTPVQAAVIKWYFEARTE